MGIDLSRYKVVYGDKVLHAVALDGLMFPESVYPFCGKPDTTIIKPAQLCVLAINEDGNLVAINDEAWRFQFIPIIHKGD